MNQRDTILIADDMEVNRAILRKLFEGEFNLLEAENGQQALLLVQQYHSFLAAVLLDVVMPEKNGYDVLTEMGSQGLLSEVPVILITAETTSEGEIMAFDLGASDLIIKPFEPHVIRRRVRNIVELSRHKHHLEELVEEQAITLRQSNEIMLDALSSVIEHRSMESGQHVLRIRSFTRILLEDVRASFPEYGLNDEKIALIARASALHDIGKIAIPDAVLNKPGRLTKEEFEEMKTHTTKGCEIMQGLDRLGDRTFLYYAHNICRYHHERWNGGGYPEGLGQEEIPLCAHVVGLADAYDALTTHRVYKGAIAPERAMTMILNDECGVFSPKLLECFKNVEQQFSALSREFGDGRSPRAPLDDSAPTSSHQGDMARDTLTLGQMKYISLLRYLRATVMEVDFISGIYHVVYLASSDFETLRAHANFSDSFTAFANGAVHPDDRAMVLEMLGDYAASIFSEGLMLRSREYRVYHHLTGQYMYYTATLLRMDASDTYSSKAIFIWEPTDKAKAMMSRVSRLDSAEGDLLNQLLGVVKCRNDAGYTVAYSNEGFTAITGYTSEDLKKQFENHYINLIYPDDWDGVQRSTAGQLRDGVTADLEYRLRTKAGKLIWILHKSVITIGEDGREYLSCVVLDNTASKKDQENLRLTVERHQIIMDQTNDIIFEWDIAADQLLFSSNWEKHFGYSPLRRGITSMMPLTSHIIPEDLPIFNQMSRDIAGGAPYREADMRIANAAGRYIWCRVRATAQFDDGGKTIKAVGVIADVDQEKRQLQNLLDRAERDGLTQMYNKQTARRLVEHFLDKRQETDCGAMLILDVDDFKRVNDRLGHMFGDAVLAKIAMVIQGVFRTEDLVARIGGDEFMVFMRHQGDIGQTEACARNVICALREAMAEDLGDCNISCSIGISLCPQDGVDYQTLYQRCDKALYRAKELGKNRFSRYQQESMKAPNGAAEPDHQRPVRTRIESDEQSETLGNTFVQEAFRLLYDADDVGAAVSSILEMIGRKYNVSRVYIFETQEDNTFNNTFEWCNAGIAPEIHLMQHMDTICAGGDYRNNFSERDIFYCPDVAALSPALRDLLAGQNIKSMLQCAMRSGGRFAGYVGYEDSRSKHLWTQNQIDTLMFLAHLLTTFLLKKRAQDQATNMTRDLKRLLDNQNSWIYVIDPDTFELQYINEKTMKIAPNATLGATCYGAFFGEDAVCLKCPARGIREKINQTMEIYNQALKVWVIADASLTRWGGKEAILISCQNITRLKEGK